MPPPGIRPPFPNLGAPAVISEAGSDDMDIEMEVVPPSQPVTTRDERHRDRDERHRDREDRQRPRESRWNREEKTPTKSDVAVEKVDVPRRSDDGGGGLLSRLRNLAGHENAGPVDGPNNHRDGPPPRGKCSIF